MLEASENQIGISKQPVMNVVQIKDKMFTTYLSSERIQGRIADLASDINRDYAGKKPLLLCVLNGAFMFASDLMKKLTVECEISFVRVKSYEGTQSSGEMKELLGLTESIEDRDVILIEDIVDTGHTLSLLLKDLESKKPASLRTAILLHKPEAVKVPLNLDYVAFDIPNDFIVGYGLDYDGFGRNLNDIYVIC